MCTVMKLHVSYYQNIFFDILLQKLTMRGIFIGESEPVREMNQTVLREWMSDLQISSAAATKSKSVRLSMD